MDRSPPDTPRGPGGSGGAARTAVLVVDDDSGFADLLRRQVLAMSGGHRWFDPVDVAVTATMARVALHRRTPALVLLAEHLQGPHGFGLEAVAGGLRRPPVVVLVPETSPFERLLERIDEALQDRPAPRLRLVAYDGPHDDAADRPSDDTAREDGHDDRDERD